MKVNDAVIGVALVAFALAMIWHTQSFPAMPGQDYGPALFPRVIGAGFVVTGLILIAGGLARRRTEPWLAGANWLRSRPPRGPVPGRDRRVDRLYPDLRLAGLHPDLTGRSCSAGSCCSAPASRSPRWSSRSPSPSAVNYAFSQLLLVPLPLGLLQRLIY